MITTIFFDFDDTLSPGPVEGYLPKDKIMSFGVREEQYQLMVEFEKREADNYFFFENSREINTLDLEKERQRKFYSDMADEVGIEKKEDFLNYILDYRFNKMKFTLYPEVEKVIAENSGHYKMYLLTNALPSREREMKETAIFKYMEGAFISNLINCGKPSKDIYEYALKAAGVNAEEAVFIDDKERFVLPAIELGLRGVIMDRKKKYLESKLDRVENLVDFFEILKTK